MQARFFLLFAFLSCLAGCASTPIAVDTATVIANPDQFRNKYNDYRTWIFSIGTSANYQIMASEEGFNPSTIEKAYSLVEEAHRAGEPVTVTGKLRVGPYRELESGMEVELVSVRYRDTEINTDRGPFVGHYYYPYYYPRPVFLHFGYYHHYH